MLRSMMPDDKTVGETPAAPAPGTRALELLGKRPPLPPEPVDGAWTWTPEKLKAVYLEAFTDLPKAGPSGIAVSVGVNPATLHRWRAHPDYKRYRAELVFTDGAADRVERVKTRKAVLERLTVQILARLEAPGALAKERLASIVKAHGELLNALQADVDAHGELTAVPPGRARGAGADLVARIAAIQDPQERETVRRHLLALFREYVQGEPGPVLDAEPTGPEQAGSGAEQGAPESSMLDASSLEPDDATGAAAGPELSLDDLDDGPTAAGAGREQRAEGPTPGSGAAGASAA